MPGLVRLIVLIAVIVIVLTMAKKLLQNRSASKSKKKNASTSKKTLQCDHCGIYIPADEAIHDDDKTFCCEQHQAMANKDDE